VPGHAGTGGKTLLIRAAKVYTHEVAPLEQGGRARLQRQKSPRLAQAGKRPKGRKVVEPHGAGVAAFPAGSNAHSTAGIAWQRRGNDQGKSPRLPCVGRRVELGARGHSANALDEGKQPISGLCPGTDAVFAGLFLRDKDGQGGGGTGVEKKKRGLVIALGIRSQASGNTSRSAAGSIYGGQPTNRRGRRLDAAGHVDGPLRQQSRS